VLDAQAVEEGGGEKLEDDDELQNAEFVEDDDEEEEEEEVGGMIKLPYPYPSPICTFLSKIWKVVLYRSCRCTGIKGAV
jgi:hypothetical protein